jgi:hypothetical protein
MRLLFGGSAVAVALGLLTSCSKPEEGSQPDMLHHYYVGVLWDSLGGVPFPNRSVHVQTYYPGFTDAGWDLATNENGVFSGDVSWAPAVVSPVASNQFWVSGAQGDLVGTTKITYGELIPEGTIYRNVWLVPAAWLRIDVIDTVQQAYASVRVRPAVDPADLFIYNTSLTGHPDTTYYVRLFPHTPTAVTLSYFVDGDNHEQTDTVSGSSGDTLTKVFHF